MGAATLGWIVTGAASTSLATFALPPPRQDLCKIPAPSQQRLRRWERTGLRSSTTSLEPLSSKFSSLLASLRSCLRWSQHTTHKEGSRERSRRTLEEWEAVGSAGVCR